MVELSYPFHPRRKGKAAAAPRRSWEAELRIAALLIGFGLVALPIAVYLVGQQVFGEYAAEAGWWGLTSAIWGDLAAGSVAAWVLVLSPYVVIQLVRLGLAAWRHG